MCVRLELLRENPYGDLTQASAIGLPGAGEWPLSKRGAV
jgi:hypothetical protein